MTETWTEDRIRRLGVRTDLVTAGEIIGVGRTKAYAMAREGEFPVRVLKHGSRYVVPVAPLLGYLGLGGPSGAGGRVLPTEQDERAEWQGVGR